LTGLLLVLAAELGALQAQLSDASALRRFRAAEAIGRLGEEGRPALRALIDRLGDEEAFVKLAAARAIVRVGITAKEAPGLVERLELVPPEVSPLLAEALAAQPASVEPLREALDGPRRLRWEAARALSWMGRRAARALPALLDLTAADDAALRKIASEAVRRLAPWSGACVSELVERLGHEKPEVRRLAARLLGRAGPAAEAAIPALRKAAKDGDARLANFASAALRQIDVAAAKAALEAPRKPNAARLRAPEKFRVTLFTTKGEIVVEVVRAWAPRGADRFYNLVKLGFFDDTRFFRVLPGFVAQFGLHGNPKVNAAWREAEIEDDPPAKPNERGTIAFAKAGPNSRTTQVFFNLGDNEALDKGFAPFGRVVEGIDVLDELHGGHRDRPDQNSIQHEGNAYLDREFPKLDAIRRAVLE